LTKWKEDEFIMSALKSVQGDINHVVCFTKYYIFDSNAPYALNFSKESLDVVCSPQFQQLHRGFYYHHRTKKEIWQKYNACPPTAG
jgi:hypothetical protein